ncbi:MAG: hypothetical protein ACM3N4_01375, partial [Nitrososphaerota archaeon]
MSMDKPSEVNAWSPSHVAAPLERMPNTLDGPSDDSGTSIRHRREFFRDLHWKELLGYTILFGAVYSACFRVHYAVTDTYTMFAASLHGTLWQQDQLSIVGGRPLQALFNDVA